MNKRVTLQYPAQTADGMGAFTTVWTDSETVWAAVWPVAGREIVKNMAVPVTISHRIRIRYRSGVLPYWRVMLGTRYLNIVSIINIDEKNEFLDLVCKEDI